MASLLPFVYRYFDSARPVTGTTCTLKKTFWNELLRLPLQLDHFTLQTQKTANSITFLSPPHRIRFFHTIYPYYPILAGERFLKILQLD